MQLNIWLKSVYSMQKKIMITFYRFSLSKGAQLPGINKIQYIIIAISASMSPPMPIPPIPPPLRPPLRPPPRLPPMPRFIFPPKRPRPKRPPGPCNCLAAANLADDDDGSGSSLVAA